MRSPPTSKVAELAPTCAEPEGECCRNYHHGDLRRCLLEAASELIVERGVAGTSLREIARRAGVSNRAPYHHFADKMGLLAELARIGFEDLRASMRSHADVADPDERLRLLGQAYTDFARDHAGAFQTMYWAELCEPDNFPDRDDSAEPCFQLLVQALAELARGTADEAELEKVAIAGWATVHGIAMLRAQGVLDKKTDDESVEAMVSGVVERATRMLASEARRLS